MVRIPPITNEATMRRKESGIIQQIGITLFLDLLEEKKEAYFLDVDNGTNQIGALAFRLANGANDTLNFLLGEPLAETPTVQDVVDNPLPHFQRLMIGTNLDVRRAVAEDPGQASQISAGLQRRRAAGETLVQVIANAVNADKDTRTAFDSYLIQARELAIQAVEQVTVTAVSGLDENIARLVNGLSDFVIEAAFARPRRTGDGKRVSKEIHEFNYLSQQVITTYGPEQLGQIREPGWTHLDIALTLIQTMVQRGVNGETGLAPGVDIPSSNFVQIVGDNLGDAPADLYDPARFSYGNFVDSYHLRRLLAELKKLVQASRADNVLDALRTGGGSREQYINDILLSKPPQFVVAAANELFINFFENPDRPVRETIDSTELVQVFIGEEDQ